MSRFGSYKINGVKYDLDDLTLDEIEAIENLCEGAPFSDISFGSSKAMKAIATTLLRRQNPGVTAEEIGAIKVINFAPADEEMPDTGPPAEGEAESQNGSALADSGAQVSAGSIGG